MISLALAEECTVSSRPSRLGEFPARRHAVKGEIGLTLRRLSMVHLRAALYRLRFGAWLGQARLSEIEDRLSRFGALERLADGSFALLDIGPSAAKAMIGETPAQFPAGVAGLFNWHELGALEIAACGFWTDEIMPDEPPLPQLQQSLLQY